MDPYGRMVSASDIDTINKNIISGRELISPKRSYQSLMYYDFVMEKHMDEGSNPRPHVFVCSINI